MPSCQPLSSRPPHPPATTLLDSLKPEFSSPVHVINVRRAPRRLELRANVVLLFRHQTANDPSRAASVLPLLPSTRIRPPADQTDCSIRLNRCTIFFPSARQTSAFYHLVQRVLVRLNATPPRYALHAPLSPLSASRVFVTTRQADPRLLALKSVPKPAALPGIIAARKALARVNAAQSPFTVRLVDTFETARHYHFVAELAALGDLCAMLTQLPDQRLPERAARALAAELVLAVRDLHDCGVRHRSIAASNVLLTGTGHVRLSDFSRASTSRMLPVLGPSRAAWQGVGSVGFYGDLEGMSGCCSSRGSLSISEDTILRPALSGATGGDAAEEADDVQALGALIFQTLTGRHPFPHRSPCPRSNICDEDPDCDVTNPSIRDSESVRSLRGPPIIPSDVSAEARDLLRLMLMEEETKRIGIQGVMAHKWFADVQWETVRRCAIDDEKHVELIAVLKEHEVSEVFKRRLSRESWSEDEGRAFSVLSTELYEHESTTAERRGRRKWNSGQQLLGFDYL